MICFFPTQRWLNVAGCLWPLDWFFRKIQLQPWWLNSWGECSLNPCFCHFGTFGAGWLCFFFRWESQIISGHLQLQILGGKTCCWFDWMEIKSIEKKSPLLTCQKKILALLNLPHVCCWFLFIQWWVQGNHHNLPLTSGCVGWNPSPSSWDKSILRPKTLVFGVWCLPYQAGVFCKRISEPIYEESSMFARVSYIDELVSRISSINTSDIVQWSEVPVEMPRNRGVPSRRLYQMCKPSSQSGKQNKVNISKITKVSRISEPKLYSHGNLRTIFQSSVQDAE